MDLVITNRAKCKKCNTSPQSFTVHHYVQCNCGSIAVDGGNDYLRRSGNLEDIEEMSVVLKNPTELEKTLFKLICGMKEKNMQAIADAYTRAWALLEKRAKE